MNFDATGSRSAGSSRRHRKAWPLRRLAAIAFSVVLAIVAVLMLTPGDALPQTNIWDKLEHATAFAALTALGHLAVERRRHRLLLMIGLIGFGILTELLQTFVPGRSCEAADAVADAAGVLVATILWWLTSGYGKAERSYIAKQDSPGRSTYGRISERFHRM